MYHNDVPLYAVLSSAYCVVSKKSAQTNHLKMPFMVIPSLEA